MLLLNACGGAGPVETPAESPPVQPPEITETEPPLPDMSCTDFAGFADNVSLGASVTLDSITFTKLGIADLYVNEVAPGVRGLAFDNDGLEISLGTAVAEVFVAEMTLTAGAYFPEPVVITAYDASNTPIDVSSVPYENLPRSLVLWGGGITRVTMIGGGNEGVLVSICVPLGSMPQEDACLDFSGFQDGANLGDSFALEQVTFSRLGSAASDDLIVAGADVASRGLSFDEVGAEVTFADPPTGVTVEARSDTSQPVTITAHDQALATFNSVEIQGGGMAQSVSLDLGGWPIAGLTVTGGNNEGFIIRVCWGGV
jgi:hypothetical protein